jgi:hypothetical protein
LIAVCDVLRLNFPSRHRGELLAGIHGEVDGELAVGNYYLAEWDDYNLYPTYI